MAATIIQFPQQQSVAFMNLTQLINLASDNQVVEEYAEIMAVCHEEGNFKPGEVETLQEQIRARRLENARPEEKPAAIPEKPGLYCYTPEMGEQKPKCQIEAERSYYGRHYHIKENYIIVDENDNVMFGGQHYTEVGADRVWNMYNGIYEDENGERYIYIKKVEEE